jgi:hypothetical protein
MIRPRPSDHFAIATLDELWIGGVRRESRCSHGTARGEGSCIIASHERDDALVARCEESIAELRGRIVADARVRLVANARRVAGVVMSDATMTVTIDGLSAVTGDAATLRALLAIERQHERGDLPLVWRNGSGAVLLHEAVGHAAEHGAPPVSWPEWLHVHDEPAFALDDCGHETRNVNLLREAPASLRRASFRDVPLLRMANLVVTQTRAPSKLPARHVDVFLVSAGGYDPLTDEVTIDIAVSTAGPFSLRRKRAEVAASLMGAIGDPVTYPGVICAREGQELSVGSAAPVMITR